MKRISMKEGCVFLMNSPVYSTILQFYRNIYFVLEFDLIIRNKISFEVDSISTATYQSMKNLPCARANLQHIKTLSRNQSVGTLADIYAQPITKQHYKQVLLTLIPNRFDSTC